MHFKDGPEQQIDIQRLLNRVSEIEQTQKCLIRELEESIEATSHVLREIEDRGRSSFLDDRQCSF